MCQLLLRAFGLFTFILNTFHPVQFTIRVLICNRMLMYNHNFTHFSSYFIYLKDKNAHLLIILVSIAGFLLNRIAG